MSFRLSAALNALTPAVLPLVLKLPWLCSHYRGITATFSEFFSVAADITAVTAALPR